MSEHLQLDSCTPLYDSSQAPSRDKAAIGAIQGGETVTPLCDSGYTGSSAAYIQIKRYEPSGQQMGLIPVSQALLGVLTKEGLETCPS